MSEDYRDAVEVDFASADLETIIKEHPWVRQNGASLYKLHEDTSLPDPCDDCSIKTTLFTNPPFPRKYQLVTSVNVGVTRAEKFGLGGFMRDGVARLRESGSVREAREEDVESFPIKKRDNPDHVAGDSEEGSAYISPVPAEFYIDIRSRKNRIPDFQEAVTDFGETLETFVNGAFRDYDFKETQTIRAYS